MFETTSCFKHNVGTCFKGEHHIRAITFGFVDAPPVRFETPGGIVQANHREVVTFTSRVVRVEGFQQSAFLQGLRFTEANGAVHNVGGTDTSPRCGNPRFSGSFVSYGEHQMVGSIIGFMPNHDDWTIKGIKLVVDPSVPPWAHDPARIQTQIGIPVHTVHETRSASFPSAALVAAGLFAVAAAICYRTMMTHSAAALLNQSSPSSNGYDMSALADAHSSPPMGLAVAVGVPVAKEAALVEKVASPPPYAGSVI